MRNAVFNVEDFELGGHRTGWQHEAAARVEWQHREQSSDERALLRSPCVSCYPFPRVIADVAVSPTVLAIIVHRARRQGSSKGVGSQWRAQPHLP